MLHSDSAVAYTNKTAKGVVEQFSVNHTEKEYARSVAIKKRVGSSATRAGVREAWLLTGPGEL